MKFSDKFPKLNLYKVIDVNKDYLEDEDLEVDGNGVKVKRELGKFNLNVVDGEIQDATLLNSTG
jgi:hypothetical protein